MQLQRFLLSALFTTLIASIPGNLCDRQSSCNQCTSYLVELLDQINLDLNYANKTIEKSRANAKFGLKLEQLELAFNEHAIGLNKSEAMYQQATGTIIRLAATHKTENASSDEDAIKILRDLESKVQHVAELTNVSRTYSKDYDDATSLNETIEELRYNLTSKLQMIAFSRDRLREIDRNFLNLTIVTPSEENHPMVELGGGVIKRMVRESRAMIRAQENGCEKLGGSLEELTLLLRQINMDINYIKTIQDSSALYSGIVSKVVNSTLRLHLEDLDNTNQAFCNTINLARAVSESFLKLNQTLKFRDLSEGSDASVKVLRLGSQVSAANLRVSRIAKNLKAGSNQLPEFSRFQNGSETIDLSTKLSDIRTHLVDLNQRIFQRWPELMEGLSQYHYNDSLRNAIADFVNLTRLDAWQGFFGLESSIDLVSSNVNSMLEIQAKIDQLQTNFSQTSSTLLGELKRVEEEVFTQLMPNLTTTRLFVARLETELVTSQSEAAKVNSSIMNDMSEFAHSSLVDGMKNLTMESNSSTSSVLGLVEKSQRMIDEFSLNTQSLHKQDHRSQLGGIEEVFKYLGTSSSSKTSDKPQIFTLADWLLNDVNKTLRSGLNVSQAAELTRLSSTEMQQISVRLRNKVSHARSLINQFCQVPEYGRMISFPRPKSNISSSFVQSLNLNHEFDELMLEHSGQTEDNLGVGGSFNLTNGHIRRLKIKFRSLQPNGLLVHHSRPDHSSFMSVYITGGRLMLALNFDKKIRIESHISLSDGQWHTLYLIVSRRMSHHHQQKQQQQQQQLQNGTTQKSGAAATGGCNRVKHSICAILDDSFTYKSRFSVCFEPISSAPKVSAVTNHRELSRRSVEAGKDNTSVVPSTPSTPMTNLTERLFNHADDESNWQEQSKKILYFGGVEDKYIPLLRNQQIPTNFHGCIADVSINNIKLNFLQSKKNQALLVNHCQPD